MQGEKTHGAAFTVSSVWDVVPVPSTERWVPPGLHQGFATLLCRFAVMVLQVFGGSAKGFAWAVARLTVFVATKSAVSAIWVWVAVVGLCGGAR